MKSALDKAHEEYVARKMAERRAQILRLRQELLAALPRQMVSSQVRDSNAHAPAETSQPLSLRG